jgi:hypothetical protein
MSEKGKPAGRAIRLDPTAKSQTPGQPAFLSKPTRAPVYHGFPVLDDVEVDGFRLGMITDWEAAETDVGDSFVVAPDGSRAGLVWEVADHFYVTECLAATADRWGVWNVGFTRRMRSREAARANLADLLAVLAPVWQQWKAAPKPGIDS